MAHSIVEHNYVKENNFYLCVFQAKICFPDLSSHFYQNILNSYSVIFCNKILCINFKLKRRSIVVYQKFTSVQWYI